MFGLFRSRNEKEITKFADRQIQRLETQADELEHTIEAKEKMYDELLTEKRELKEEVENLKLKKKIEEEDIKHMVKMKEEAAELDRQKFEVKLNGEKQDEIHKIKAEHADKLQSLLNTQIEQGEARYKEILGRLPDVQVNMGNNQNNNG